ncbi:MAG: PsiF family protein [Rhodoferax sp.]
MKQLFTILGLGLGLALGPVHATEAAKNPQQTKMAQCNKEAGDKKGDERKAFMKECLGAKPAPVADKKAAQQEKMKACNQQAGDKKGNERKAFMKECLSAKS